MSVGTTPSWEWVSAFLEVMRRGSLSGASRTMKLAQPTVRRRIAALEEHLGSPLFSRAPNGLVPTELARRLLPFAETMEATSHALVREASGTSSSVEGTVRVAASPLMSVEVLPPMLRRLRDSYPQVDIELLASNDVVDLVRRDADIAVRMAPLAGANLVARRVGHVLFGLFGSVDYFQTRSVPESPADLLSHELVGYDQHPQVVGGLKAMGVPVERRDFWIRTDNDLAYLSSLRAGLGIGVTQVTLATDLVRVLPHLQFPVDVWLVAHEDLRKVPRIRVILDGLARELEIYVSGAA